jgi:uncharacterized glyoxalase superfamily protein PhnB
MSTETLRLYAEGKAFAEGRFYLRETVRLLENTRMLLDTALVTASNRERMTADLKEAVNYEIEIRKGSIDTYITLSELASQALPLFVPFTTDVMARLPIIFDYVKKAKKLVEWLGAKRQKGINVNVEVSNSPGAVVLVAGDGDIYHTTQTELYGGLRFFQPLKQLSELCDGERVETIKFFEKEDKRDVEPSIVIDSSTKQLYRAETEIDNLSITVVGSLFDLNTKNSKGKLETGDGNSVSVQIAKSADVHAFAQLAYDKGPIEFTARPLMKIINGVSTVSGYELVSFVPPRQKEMNV